jgi:multidrug efflux pump subunit AcrB
MGLNLSEWALNNRSLTVYLMIVTVVAGAFSYFRLGRAEDPSFVIKTMVVSAAWPGASVEDTLKQVTERLERKLQETPRIDNLRSFTRAGATTIFVNLKDATPAGEIPASGIMSAKASAISAIRCRPAPSAPSSTTTSATRSASSTASPPTASPIASCATASRTPAPDCFQSRT